MENQVSCRLHTSFCPRIRHCWRYIKNKKPLSRRWKGMRQEERQERGNGDNERWGRMSEWTSIEWKRECSYICIMMFPSLSNLTWISSIPEQSLHSVDTISSFAEISSFVFYAKYIACGRNACLWMVKRLRGIDSIPLMVFSGFLAFLLKSHIFVGYGCQRFMCCVHMWGPRYT